MARISRYVYAVIAWLFVIGVMVQVFLAGMVVVALKLGWDYHITLGHTLAAPLLLMLIFMYMGQLPGLIKWMTWALFGVYVLQADVLIFLRIQAPVLSAFHPVMALVDFALGVALARRAGMLTRQVQAITQAKIEAPSTN
ncbi:MAG TPA: DUF6220 domain-containing protein [Anaerolineaceae bacterium]|nr:DUF6220 domain-containing protein [Anaerolineaceae bacterium]